MPVITGITIAAGWTAVTLVNESDEPRLGQLYRLAADKSSEDAAAALVADSNNLPEWLTPVGGIAIVVPGATQRVMLDLEPGSYILADPVPGFGGVLGIDKGYFMPVTVEASESMAAKPVADMTLGLADYAFLFDCNAVTAGQRLHYKNTLLEKTWLNEENGWFNENFEVVTTLLNDENGRKIRSKLFRADTRVELGGNGGTGEETSMYHVVVVPVAEN